MELLSTLSKETSNSLKELLNMDFHLILGMYNTLRVMAKKQEEEEKKQQEKQRQSTPSMPSMSSISSAAKSAMPRMPSK